MMNLYLKIKWSTALLLGILLVLTGVIGMFIPLVPEIAVILLGMWLLGATAVNPVGRRRLHQREEHHRSTTPLHPLVVAAFLLTTVLYGCQEKMPEPEKVKSTLTIENLQTAYGKEVNRQQKIVLRIHLYENRSCSIQRCGRNSLS